MLLLIAGETDAGFKKDLSLFKYRADVKLLESLTENDSAKIMAAAYAFVYPVLYADLAMPVLAAMQCEIPVICSDTGSLPSLFADAALFADPGNVEGIAENMMLIFKDEEKAKNMVNAGKALLQQYQAEKSAQLLMQCILKAFNN